jgi:predicted DCC family thiol-disulfide oxidoreductase YuxK
MGSDPEATPVVLYDGGCGLCGWSVRLVLRHDRLRRFRFAPLESPIATRLLAQHGLPDDPRSVVLLEGGRAVTRSDAVLAIVRRLGGGWHLLRVAALLPRPLRDWCYDGLARRRGRLSRWFGTRPITTEERHADDRFLA